MEAFNTLCTKDFCEYDNDRKLIEAYDWDNEIYNKVCDVEVVENKRGFFIKISMNKENILIEERDMNLIKNNVLRVELLSLIEEAEEIRRRFYEPDPDDWHEEYKLRN